MNTRHSLFSGFAVFGHRGAAGLLPENTLPGFERALAIGCRGIELDVHCVKDANGQTQLCVIHDAKVDRTTNSRGLVADFTVSELQAMDAGNGWGVPLLTDVLVALDRSPETLLNIELKGPATATPTAALLKARPNLRVLVSSFNHDELTRFRALAPTCPVAPLFHRPSSKLLDTARRLGAVSINVSRSLVSKDLIANCKQAGFAVLVYTVNEPEQAQQLKDWGAAGVFTDRPDLMISLQD